MSQDRRTNPRCPVCQGPAKEASGEIRCRNSMCSFNHQRVSCPRCQHQGPEVSEYKGDTYKYTCPECTHAWSGKP